MYWENKKHVFEESRTTPHSCRVKELLIWTWLAEKNNFERLYRRPKEERESCLTVWMHWRGLLRSRSCQPAETSDSYPSACQWADGCSDWHANSVPQILCAFEHVTVKHQEKSDQVQSWPGWKALRDRWSKWYSLIKSVAVHQQAEFLYFNVSSQPLFAGSKEHLRPANILWMRRKKSVFDRNWINCNCKVVP